MVLNERKVKIMCTRWIAIYQKEYLNLFDIHDMVNETYNNVCNYMDNNLQDNVMIRSP